MISLIVAKARNNVIGSRNNLPWYLSADLRRFKELTTNETVVMGRRTYESILSRLGHGLPDRRNVVLSRQSLDFVDAEVVHDLRDIDSFGDVFIIGGEEIYRSMIDRADILYVTEIHADIDGDAYFPEIDLDVWRETSREPRSADDRNQYDFDFVTYERR